MQGFWGLSGPYLIAQPYLRTVRQMQDCTAHSQSCTNAVRQALSPARITLQWYKGSTSAGRDQF